MSVKNKKLLLEIYRKLHAHFGSRHWWPARTPFEVMVGAILTQNTAWGNVEKAIQNLRKHRLLTPRRMKDVSNSRLKALIKPSGFFNEKCKKLKNLVSFLFESSGGNIKKLKLKKGNLLREELLAIKGVGPETADSILLYALGKPVFVVDAYTRRVFERHDLIQADATYNQIQEFFTRYLSGEQNLFNEYHALIVELGKNYCKKLKPRCAECPLSSLKKRKKWSNTQKV